MTTLERIRHTLRTWFGPMSSGDPALRELFGSKGVSSGVSVTEDQALALTAVWACVSLIAGTLGSLPLFPYRRLKGGGKERMYDSKLYRLLHDQANPEMSSAMFRETMQAYILLWGNGIAEITRDGNDRPAGLWPIEPWRVQPERDGRTLRYRISNDGRPDSILRPEQVIHIPGLSTDGVWGMSVIRKAREAVGLGLATEKFGATFFGQGATFGGVVEHPGRLSDTARENLRDSINKRHQGVERAHQFVIFEEGMKYVRLGIPPEDAQFLETRKFQRSEYAIMFGVPPHMIGDVERSTSWGTGIEAQNIGFVTYTMRRWFVRWEQELTRKLISPMEWQQQSIEFLIDGLLRGDTTTRYAAYNIGRNGGWFSANDIRELENMNPLPGEEGDVYLIPANMLPVDKVLNTPEPAPAPAPAPAPDPAMNGNGNGNGNGREVLDALHGDIRALLAREPVPDPVVMQAAQTAEGALEAVRELLAREPAPPPEPDPAVVETVEGVRALLAREPVPPPEPDPAVAEALEGVRTLLTREPPPPAEPLPPLDLSPLLDRLDVAEAERRALREQLATVLPGVLGVLERAVHDFVRREGDRARRAASSPEKLAAWVTDFYPRQGDYGVKTLGHVMYLYTALRGRPDDTEREIRDLVARYVTESTEALTALAAGPPEALKAAVDALATRWETERPAALAAALLQEVVADATV